MFTRTTYEIIFDSGLEAAREGRFHDAYQIWLPLAKEGYTDAQINVGVLLHNGWGVQQNIDAANDWFAIAAQNGHRVQDSLFDMIESVKRTSAEQVFVGGRLR